MIKTAVELQSGPLMIAFSVLTVQFSPGHVPEGGCSSLPEVGMSQETAGKFPLCASLLNRAWSTMLPQSGPLRMWLMAANVVKG